jgi:arabinose-5-phosphate isomerase
MESKRNDTGTQAIEDIATGKAVIAQEIKGLEELIPTLAGDFAAAVELIASVRGRLIITGMGKSGHIGCKLAATFASTGTPAFFVHPGEASHGDLGMVMKEDIIIALSNSGQTDELRDIIAYAKRFNIPLISIVRRQDSLLAESSNIALVMPDTKEASSVKAPTTSTTMTLALGDALAIAVSERKGFNDEAFNVFHPGGKLGKAFLTVANLMHKSGELPLVAPKLQMKDVLIIMTAKRFGCAAVIDEDRTLLGIITDGDLRRHMDSSFIDKTAAEVMTKNPITIRPNALAAEAVGVMNERSITSLFVLEEGKPIGIIHIHDCLRAGVDFRES